MPRYPARLRANGFATQYPDIWTVGDDSLVNLPLLGLVCSVRCPGNVILQTYDLARALRDAQVPVIGGFHSPMEKECLDLLLRGTQPVIICPARSLTNMRIPPAWQGAIDGGRLLVISPFADIHRRPTAALSQELNRFVTSLSVEVVVPYADPHGRAKELCRELTSRGTTVWTLDLAECAAAKQAGARPTSPAELAQYWKSKLAGNDPRHSKILAQK